MSRWHAVGLAGVASVGMCLGCGPSPSVGATRAPTSEPPTTTPTPSEAPSPTPVAAPIQERELRPGPDLHKIVMGVDSPEVVETKIGATQGSITCPPEILPKGKLSPAEKRTESRRKTICWVASGLKDTPQVRASFYDYGVGAVIYDLWFVYPLSSWGWLPEATRAALGPADPLEGGVALQSWDWAHTQLVLRHDQCTNMMDPETCKVVQIGITHWPTMSLSSQGVTDRSKSVADRDKPASPWDLRFGYDTGSVTEAKLRKAGFVPSLTGCLDLSPGLRQCMMDGGSLPGLRNHTRVGLVNFGKGTFVSELEYTFEPSAYADTVRTLVSAYGKPVVEDDYGKSKWWTGEVGIEVWRREDSFHVIYFHGRVRALGRNALELQRAEKANASKRGL
jgi:hypothetical protein